MHAASRGEWPPRVYCSGGGMAARPAMIPTGFVSFRVAILRRRSGRKQAPPCSFAEHTDGYPSLYCPNKLAIVSAIF